MSKIDEFKKAAAFSEHFTNIVLDCGDRDKVESIGINVKVNNIWYQRKGQRDNLVMSDEMCRAMEKAIVNRIRKLLTYAALDVAEEVNTIGNEARAEAYQVIKSLEEEKLPFIRDVDEDRM